MDRKKIEPMELVSDAACMAGNDQKASGGGGSGSRQAPSRLSAAIMRILAAARGAGQARRAITPADLAPARPHDDSAARRERDGHDGDPSFRVEWTLRMMQ